MARFEKTTLTAKERECLTADPERQGDAHILGAYDYLADEKLAARYAVISGLIEQYDCNIILDIGCYVGGLRGAVNPRRAYHGIDISPNAITEAKEKYSDYSNTKFIVGDIRDNVLPLRQYECVVWAGIGYGYSDKDNHSFSDLFTKSWELCSAKGILIFECIEDYAWVRSNIEATSRLLNAFNVTHSLASVHNRRSVFVARKVSL